MAATSPLVPTGTAATTAAIATFFGLATAAPAAADEQHRVQPGDTVSHLAHRYGSTIPAIVAANDLDSRATIYVGTTVTVPSHSSKKRTSTVTTLAATYTVKSGDTLSAIAQRHGTTVAALARDNKLANASLIFPGQRLTIGGSGTAESTTSSTKRTASSTTRTSATYTVEAGDTLSGIAHRHGTTVSAIAKANSLANASFIRIGQRLSIPGAAKATPTAKKQTTSTSTTKKTSERTVYTVKSGDTLSAIAQRHGTTVAALARENTLANASLIRVGQRLSVPGEASKPLVGDTFAGRTYASDIVKAANLNKAKLLTRTVPSRDKMQAIIVATAREHGVDPALAQAVSYQESGFDMRAVSPANAVGVMQVIPTSGEWASDMAGRRLDLLDPRDNVLAGILILRALNRTFDKVDDAIAGYYQGAAAVLDHGYHSDTVGYVASVKALMGRFR
ncbi:lytic transglycosylase domain-containing protein [Demequina mangrovi]|uniref:LysM repeat-containing protein n=1 Tax=Demequina mangrovi TaxID=1043493 RepID=A0A1H6UB44_9MICO|nr:lytic transglycosylase domain-containing protein [Demequina mangrovi]SEI89588.1 LysM repeat-containing protein [Demequina mangrovi]